MTEPRWLNAAAVQAIQYHLVVQHGGRHGIRDEVLLETALATPRRRFRGGITELTALGAEYTTSLISLGVFVDSNERTALAAGLTFLEMNGVTCSAREQEAVVMVRDLASGRCSNQHFAKWLAVRQAL